MRVLLLVVVIVIIEIFLVVRCVVRWIIVGSRVKCLLLVLGLGSRLCLFLEVVFEL